MTEALRDAQLAQLCDVLDRVGPDAATLCEGWDAHDLAAHILHLHRDPVAWAGIVMPGERGERLVRARLDRVRERWSFAELVERLRGLAGPVACMPTDRLEGFRHAFGEYFIHTQDVARANGLELPEPTHEARCALWRRVQAAAPVLRGRDETGLVLDWPRRATALVTKGRPGGLIVSGEPEEVMLWVYGREAVARVELTSAGAPR